MSLRDKLTTDKIVGMHDQINALEIQRDELLAALEKCQGTLLWVRDDKHSPAWIHALPGRMLLQEVSTAIARAKEQS